MKGGEERERERESMDAQITALHEAAHQCSQVGDDDGEAAVQAFVDAIIAPIEGVNTSSPNVAHPDVRLQCEHFLSEVKSLLDPSVPTGQILSDCVGSSLMCCIVRYAGISEHCRDMVTTIIKDLCEICNPREMFTSLMEALNIYSEHDTLMFCLPLLEGISTNLPRIKRRRLEFFRDALSGLFSLMKLSAESKSEAFLFLNKLWRLGTVVCDLILQEQEDKPRTHLRLYLGIFTLTLLANTFSICEKDDVIETSEILIGLSELLLFCNFTYLGLLTDKYLDDILLLLNDDCDVDFQPLELKRGALISVYWGWHFKTLSVTIGDSINSLFSSLRNSKKLFCKALINLETLLSWKLNWNAIEKGIEILNYLLTITKEDFDDIAKEDLDELASFTEVLEGVVIYSHGPDMRRKSYTTLTKVVTGVLPRETRFCYLKNRIAECSHPSMVSLMLNLTKEEAAKALTERQMAKTEVKENLLQVIYPNPFASPQVVDIIEIVLRPPKGGAPQFPDQIDTVLSALNLYRFVLIKEMQGKSNFTTVLSKTLLQKAIKYWFLPLREALAGFRMVIREEGDESTSLLLLSIDITEGVLYRCLELAEEALKEEKSKLAEVV